MSNYWTGHGETPTDRERRLALCACLNAGVSYRGVLDGICYFEVEFTEQGDHPNVRLSLPAAGITARLISEYVDLLERQKHEGTSISDIADPELCSWRCPNGHDSSIPPRLPELMFQACRHYRPTVATWNEFCIACSVRHAPLAIYWRGCKGRVGGGPGIPKNYCGYCGAKMVGVESR